MVFWNLSVVYFIFVRKHLDIRGERGILKQQTSLLSWLVFPKPPLPYSYSRRLFFTPTGMVQCLCILLNSSEPLNLASSYFSGLSSIFNGKCCSFCGLFLFSFPKAATTWMCQWVSSLLISVEVFLLSLSFFGFFLGLFLGFACLFCVVFLMNIKFSEKLEPPGSSSLLWKSHHV